MSNDARYTASDGGPRRNHTRRSSKTNRLRHQRLRAARKRAPATSMKEIQRREQRAVKGVVARMRAAVSPIWIGARRARTPAQMYSTIRVKIDGYEQPFELCGNRVYYRPRGAGSPQRPGQKPVFAGGDRCSDRAAEEPIDKSIAAVKRAAVAPVSFTAQLLRVLRALAGVIWNRWRVKRAMRRVKPMSARSSSAQLETCRQEASRQKQTVMTPSCLSNRA